MDGWRLIGLFRTGSEMSAFVLLLFCFGFFEVIPPHHHFSKVDIFLCSFVMTSVVLCVVCLKKCQVKGDRHGNLVFFFRKGGINDCWAQQHGFISTRCFAKVASLFFFLFVGVFFVVFYGMCSYIRKGTCQLLDPHTIIMWVDYEKEEEQLDHFFYEKPNDNKKSPNKKKKTKRILSHIRIGKRVRRMKKF